MHAARGVLAVAWSLALQGATYAAGLGFPKPYAPPCTERSADGGFEFAEKPAVRQAGADRYEIAFAAKGNCDATVAIVDKAGKVVRHLASGVLGANAPARLLKNMLAQTLIWDGKDDLGEYVKEPGQLQVRVSLGLKPEFHRRLGGRAAATFPALLHPHRRQYGLEGHQGA